MAPTDDDKKEKPAEGGKAPEASEAKTAAPPAEPPKPPPESPPFVKRIKEQFAEAVLESRMFADEPTLVVAPCRLLEICGFLRGDSELAFDYLACITGVDYPERTPRFDVVYSFYSIKKGHRLNVVIRVEESEPPTLCGLWPTADWHEREAYDLIGLRFAGHPKLKRILLPDWWEGHPLRKDYPLEGRGEEQRVIEECLKPRS